MIAPSTDIILYKTDLELDNTNQLKFDTWNAQWAYFSNLPHIYLDNATYQRKEGVIRFPTTDVSFDELIRYNYVSYKNEAYANKTFFAYVKNMKYINDGMTEIEIETDPYQTWQFDLIYRRCFVEREHVSNDSVGIHTIPENLESGEYVSVGSVSSTASLDYFICVCATKDPDGDTGTGTRINGVYNGLGYFLSRGYDHGGGTNQNVSITANTNLFIYHYAVTTGLSQDDIVSIFIVPRGIVDETKITWKTIQEGGGTLPCSYGEIRDNESAGLLENYLIRDPRELDGNYVPVNNKLLCFPYRYMLADNNTGSTTIYRYEDFKLVDNFINFKTYGAISPGCSIRCVPQKYKGLESNYSESISYGKFPVCAWTEDTYLNWVTQMGINNQCQAGSGIIKLATAPLMGKYIDPGQGMEQALSGVEDIANVFEEQWQKQFAPNQANGNTNNGDVNFPLGLTNITFMHMSIKNEYARIIDRYFSMFGYKVNNVKIPEIHSRKNWNYVKTINCNFSGDIPGDDLVKLRQMFDNGLTIWHNPSTFLDYSQSNYII